MVVYLRTVRGDLLFLIPYENKRGLGEFEKAVPKGQTLGGRVIRGNEDRTPRIQCAVVENPLNPLFQINPYKEKTTQPLHVLNTILTPFQIQHLSLKLFLAFSF
jgi:hypothetical protein